MKQISGRVAVVTGAGSGIGRAVSLELASQGADLALVDIDEPGLKAVRAAVEALGRKASVHLVDVSSQQQMSELPEQVLSAHGAVHILVNNAGVSVNLPFDQQSVDDLEWITRINYWGVMYGCKYFLPYLQKADQAHIVNMSSSAGLIGMTSVLRGIKCTFRASQFVRCKAQFAGNVGHLSKSCNAAAGELGGSLRASRQWASNCVALS